MLRALVIGNAEREAAKALVEFTTQPENHYKPGPGAKVPGDDPRYVAHFGTYRCVFTITEMPDGLWRHLSVSVPAKDKLPHPAAIEEIAHLFGIAGTVEEWAKDGLVAPNGVEHCVVVAARYTV